MPQIDVTQKIIDITGNPIFDAPKRPSSPDEPPKPPEQMTVRSACIQALLTADEKATGQQKFDAFRLAQKIQEEDNVHLKSEDITTIKQAVGKIFVPVVIGRVWDALDPPKNLEVVDHADKRDKK